MARLKERLADVQQKGHDLATQIRTRELDEALRISEERTSAYRQLSQLLAEEKKTGAAREKVASGRAEEYKVGSIARVSTTKSCRF